MKSTKYNRSNHFIFSNNATSDDRISKEYSFLENIEVIGTEKLDGGNICMTSNNIFARSHSVPTENPWDREVSSIHNSIKHKIGEDEFIFGEGMEATHSLLYKALDSHYYIFNVRVKDEWLSWDDVCEIAYCLDLPTVPVLFKGKYGDIKQKVLEAIEKPSMLDAYDIKTGKAMMEGCVVRNINSFHTDDFSKNLLKYVRKDHVKSDEHWTKNWKKQPLKDIFY